MWDHVDRPPTREALQALMWDHVGIVRDGDRLAAAAARLAAWDVAPADGAQAPPPANVAQPSTPNDQRPATNDRGRHELRNMIIVGRLMAEAALAREESRGAHYRTDFPHPREEWRRHIVFRKGVS
jgi:L-aspartate oxidase